MFGFTIKKKTTVLLNPILLNQERFHLDHIAKILKRESGQRAQILTLAHVFMVEGLYKDNKKNGEWSYVAPQENPTISGSFSEGKAFWNLDGQGIIKKPTKEAWKSLEKKLQN